MDKVDAARQALRSRGTVPIFPLPGVALFPHALLPLHIFEPRYRSMTADALASERLIAMAMLGGSAEGGEQVDRIVPVAGAGVIEEAVRLPDGRYLMRLRGIARVEISEFIQDSPYLIARVRMLEDRHEADGPDVERDKRQLLAVCTALRQEVTGSSGQATPVDDGIPFAAVVNTLCQSLNLDAATRIRLLRMDDVLERCRMLTRILESRWKELASQRCEGGKASGNDVH